MGRSLSSLWLEAMPLPLELLIQMLLVLVVAVNTFAETKPKYRITAHITSALLFLIGLGLLAHTVVQLVANRSSLDLRQVVSQLLLPIWLTLAALVVLYPIGLFMAYETLWIRFKIWAQPDKPSRRGFIGAARELKASLVDVNQFGGIHARDAASAGSLADGSAAVRRFRLEISQKQADERSAAARLRRFAGARGVDSKGLTLDRREFAATKAALDWLATCHMGWYRREDRPNAYRKDLLDVLGDFENRGLHGGHGITMKVRKDGQAWYAYRVTPSGHVFAIGANGAPPSQWFYDGWKPPSGYPSEAGGWTSFMDPDRPEWRVEPSTGDC